MRRCKSSLRQRPNTIASTKPYCFSFKYLLSRPALFSYMPFRHYANEWPGFFHFLCLLAASGGGGAGLCKSALPPALAQFSFLLDAYPVALRDVRRRLKREELP